MASPSCCHFLYFMSELWSHNKLFNFTHNGTPFNTGNYFPKQHIMPIFLTSTCCWSRGRVLTWLRAACSEVRFPAGATDLAFSKALQLQVREADHSTASSTEVKNKWSYTSIPIHSFMACLGTILPLSFTFLFLQKIKVGVTVCWWIVNNKLPPRFSFSIRKLTSQGTT